MQKGFGIPTVLIFVALTLIAVSIFFAVKNAINSQNVKGVLIVSSGQDSKSNLSVIVASKEGWDLFEFLCSSLDECLNSLDSGTRFAKISGGSTSAHEINVGVSSDLKKYAFLKLYVKPSWGSNERIFNVSDLGEVPGSKIYALPDGSAKYNTVIIQISNIGNKFYKSATFFDE